MLQQGDEVLHLPTIVEAAESNPSAARECAYQIRKFLSGANSWRPYVQYNAVMLMRILADNPGPTFTKNIDKKFVESLKDLIRSGADPSVQQIIRETLDTFERDKKVDTNLQLVLEMWAKERAKIAARVQSRGVSNEKAVIDIHVLTTAQDSNARGAISSSRRSNYASRSQGVPRFPTQEELASRVEEARTSAKLLTQLVQSTPPGELLQNDLVREFADRCLGANRSIQAYMAAEDPGLDNDTMLTLIETNDQLSVAISKHQRAVLQARKSVGFGTPDHGPSPSASPDAGLGRVPPVENSIASNMAPPPIQQSIVLPSARAASSENPFQDSHEVPIVDENEPYHRGFNPSKSYMGRQDRAIKKVAMHAAVPPTPAAETGARSADVAAQPSKESGPVYRY